MASPCFYKSNLFNRKGYGSYGFVNRLLIMTILSFETIYSNILVFLESCRHWWSDRQCHMCDSTFHYRCQFASFVSIFAKFRRCFNGEGLDIENDVSIQLICG